MWHVINNSHPNDVDFLARWEIKEVHTTYLLIYHDSITVFLLPYYILSDLLDEVLILPSHLQNVQRYVAPFSLYPRGDLKVVGKSFVMFCVSNLLLNIHIHTDKNTKALIR